MKALKFQSRLAPKIQTFIKLRQLSGSNYHGQAKLLGYFDRFLVKEKFREPRVSRQITDTYQQTLSRLSLRGQSNRWSVVRQFCQYLSRTIRSALCPSP